MRINNEDNCNMEEDKDYKNWIKEKENKWLAAGVVVGSVGVLSPIVILIVTRSFNGELNPSLLGTIGDFMGGTTVGLLSLASILFLISTIVMQRKELGLQREELSLTREELAKANLQYELTNETMTKQQFENTFFNMINMYKILREEVSSRNSGSQVLTGVECMSNLSEEIQKSFKVYSYRHFLNNVLNKYILKKDKELYQDYIQIMKWLNQKNIKPKDSIEELQQIFNSLIYEESMGIIGTSKFIEFEKIIFDFDVLSAVQYADQSLINNNLFCIEFNSNFLNDDSYKELAFDKALRINNISNVNNYINVVVFIFNFIDKIKFNNTDSDNYFRLLFIHLTIPELQIIKYYAFLKGNTVLVEFYNKYISIHGEVELNDLWSFRNPQIYSNPLVNT